MTTKKSLGEKGNGERIEENIQSATEIYVEKNSHGSFDW